MSANEIHLYGTVGESFWDEEFFTARMVREQLARMTGPVTVRINSGGGIATEGQAIYTILKDYSDDVHVVVDGVAASSASLIAMAGDTITMRLGAWMLIHDPAHSCVDGRGTEAEHIRIANMLNVISGAYADVYAARAGITREEARAIMVAEAVFDGQAAIDAGFATHLDTATEAAAAASFDYRIYANAPSDLRTAAKTLGESRDRRAVMAMIAGVTRTSKGEATMAVKGKTAPEASAAETEETVAAVETAASASDEIVTDAATEEKITARARPDTIAERTRCRRILDATAAAGLPTDIALDLIERGASVEVALDTVTAKWKEKGDVDTPMSGRTTATVTRDASDKFIEGAGKALEMKCGLGGERNEFSSLSLPEMARESLTMSGVTERIADRREMVGRAFTMAGSHSTSDFAQILSNVMGKAALRGWEEAEETYQMWTRPGTLSDFKATKRVGMGLFASLPEVIEGADYTYGTVSDRGEPIALATYGRILRITRQAIINDDLSLVGTMPRRMGRAARRTVGNLVYAILTGNPNMSDGVALFHASHGNLAGSGAVPSVTTMSAARTAMRTQKDAGSALNITPKYMIVPAALETAAAQLLNSVYEPTANKGHAANPVAGMAELITDARLDDASATAWFMAADPNAFDTIEVAFLDGNDAPFIEEQTAWTSDGVEMKVRVDAGVAPLDYRTLYKNAGA